MIVNINDDTKPWLENVLFLATFQTFLPSLAITKVNKYIQKPKFFKI